MTSELPVRQSLAQASFAYDRAMEGIHVYCELCSLCEFEKADLVRGSLFIYLETALDAVLQAHRLRERA